LFSRGSAEPSGEPPLRQGNGALDGKGRVSLFWNVEEFKDEFNEHLRNHLKRHSSSAAMARTPGQPADHHAPRTAPHRRARRAGPNAYAAPSSAFPISVCRARTSAARFRRWSESATLSCARPPRRFSNRPRHPGGNEKSQP
jgi:hypothetical protein